MHFLKCLPGPFQGVGEKRRSGSPFYLFARLCLQDPQAGGHLFLGFTPSPRPRVRGPAPTLLNKLGCLPGPVCGVREKKASRALSLSLLLNLSLSRFTILTQDARCILDPIQGARESTEPNKKVLFYLVDQKFTCAQVCERNLPRAQWLRECQVHSVGNGYPSLPTICTHFTDTHCSITLCHTHSIHWSQSKGSVCPPFSASNCDIPCHDSLRGLYLPISSLSASISQSFCSSLACGASILTTPDLTPKNGSLYLPFSASNCAIRCHDLLHMSNLHGSSLFHRAFYHDLTYGGCVLQLANLIAKNGSWNLPFLASNSVIRCYTWLYSCFASGLNLVAMGFYHICNHLSVTLEFWSWISSTLTLDGFTVHCA